MPAECQVFCIVFLVVSLLPKYRGLHPGSRSWWCVDGWGLQRCCPACLARAFCEFSMVCTESFWFCWSSSSSLSACRLMLNELRWFCLLSCSMSWLVLVGVLVQSFVLGVGCFLARWSYPVFRSGWSYHVALALVIMGSLPWLSVKMYLVLGNVNVSWLVRCLGTTLASLLVSIHFWWNYGLASFAETGLEDVCMVLEGFIWRYVEIGLHVIYVVERSFPEFCSGVS